VATYTQDGELIDERDAAIPTATPGIVKIKLEPGEPVPAWVMSTARQPDGSLWAYGPTNNALAMGKILAAVDTMAALPGQVIDTASEAFETVKANLPHMGVLVALVALAFIVNREK